MRRGADPFVNLAGTDMLSYIQEQLKVSKPLEEIASRRKADGHTDGESAFVYTGPETEIPRDTTRVRVDASVKRLHGQTNLGPIFSLELPENVIRMDVNDTLPATVGRTFALTADAEHGNMVAHELCDIDRHRLAGKANEADPPAPHDHLHSVAEAFRIA